MTFIFHAEEEMSFHSKKKKTIRKLSAVRIAFINTGLSKSRL